MIEKNSGNGDDLDARLRDTDGVTAALKKAARRVVNEHARDGKRIVVWRDGQVVWEEVKEQASDSTDQ